jgi:hypothetical protein
MQGKDTLVFCDTTPLKSEPKVHPPALDLSLIKLITDELLFLDESVLYGYLTSNNFLSCIAQGKKECIDNNRTRKLLLAALPDDDYPFVETAKYLARTAPKYVNIIEENCTVTHPHAEIMLVCMKYVRRLKRCTMSHFMHFLREAEYPRPGKSVYKFCTQAMLTVYAELRLHGTYGFFAVLLDSRFAEPMTWEARRAWDKLLFLHGSTSGVDTASIVDTIQAASIAYAKDTGFKSHSTPFTDEETQALHFKVEMECWQLKNAWIKAVRQSPELMILVPAENGQTEVLEARKREKKAGRPARYERELDFECDTGCRRKPPTHTRNCTRRFDRVQEEWLKTKGGDVEADVPDQEPAGVDFSFQQKQGILIPPDQVISRFNQRDIVEPFSDDEKLAALRRLRFVLDRVKGETVDRAFEWTMISEVLAGRSVADCVRFYYQHKHLIFMKLGEQPDDTKPLVLIGKPEWGPWLPTEVQAQARDLFDIDRFLQYTADKEADNTSLRIDNDALKDDNARLRYSEKFHRGRGDIH